MKVYQTGDIKNIAIIGGAKSGKTTLAEDMAFVGGVLNRRGSVDDKNSLSDYRDIELERQNSIVSTLLYSEVKGKKINILDTPGFDDFIGEVYSSLHVADTAINVVNAQNGVEVGSKITMKIADNNNTPVIFAINHLEHENSNFDETINQLKQYFGGGIIAAQYPVNAGVGFNSFIDLLQMKMFTYEEGGKVEVTDIPDAEKGKAEEMQAALIEELAANDESLMEIFFENGTLTEEEIIRGMRLGIINRGVFPVLCINAKHNMGVDRLLEFVVNNAPAPNEVPAPINKEGKEVVCDESAPVSTFIFKSIMEPHLGEVTFFKVISGTMTEGMDMINARNQSKERITQLFVFAGKNREKVEKLVAGDIGATIKLKSVTTNDTLNAGNSNEMEGIVFPEPKYRQAIKAQNSADDEKLGMALNEIKKGDPTIKSGFFKELRQQIVEGQGELHLTILKWYMENQYKIPVEYYAPKIPYRETITRVAQAAYQHKKQSGGAGQFGEVSIVIEPVVDGIGEPEKFKVKQTQRKSSVQPLTVNKGDSEIVVNVRGKDEVKLEWGGVLQFYNCIVGGAIEARFLPAILKGLMENMEMGPLTGSYARDIRVCVYDGKMHSVDSNEVSFKLAGKNAFSMAFKEAGPKILEPIYDLVVEVPEDKMGAVMTDLQSRRAIIMGMEGGTISAKVPLSEVGRYSTALSSLTSGWGTYSLKYDGYSPVPSDIQDKLLKEYEESKKEDE